MQCSPLRRTTVRGSRLAGLVIVLALATVLGHMAAGLAGAAGFNFTVNDTSDRVDVRVGDGACRTSAGTCTLRAAIQETIALPGPDTIFVPGGTYALEIPPLNQNLAANGDLDITDSLAITGAGAGATTVDGGTPQAGAPPRVHGLDRLFEVLADGGTVTFSGLTFSDGYADEYGAAIMNNSTATVTVTTSTLTGNVADKAGGAIDNHLGGAVHLRDSTLSNNVALESGSALNNNRDGTLTVTDSAISSNSAADIGLDETLLGAGAISNNAELDATGTITVTGSQIGDNAAGGSRSGAAISNDGAGTVTVDQTIFSKNRANVDGGAIFNGAGEVIVTGSTFSENAGKNGGAIFNVKDGRMTVSDSTFSLNTASARGGAIASGGTASLTVTQSTFSKNSAEGWGGAIVNDDKGSVTIQSSAFRENSGLNGGGFANEGDGLVTVENSTFTQNTAFVTTVLASGEGGGMHTNSSGDVVITGGAFSENKARSGGGLGNEGAGQLRITGTRFSSNTAEEKGGGILIQSGTIRMLDIDVIGNFADAAIEAGGGIAYEGDKLVSTGEAAAIENSRIRDNKAKGQGGGIDSRGDGPLHIATTSITGNTAATGGGIHHVGDAPLEVTRSTLSGNFAESGGGLLTDGDGETIVENATVSSNRAGQFGGGLLASSRLSIRSSTVAGNNAASGGGISNGGGDLVGDGTVFLLNTIVANSPTGGNCIGTMTSLGGNIDSGNTCQLRELSDQPGTVPRLGPLADNGGPTQTHALLADSPAQEKAICTEVEPCPPVDQRGVARPIFTWSDIGAYESELTPGGGGGDQTCAGRSERPVLSDFDSWVSQNVPGANFGTDSILKVKSLSGGNQRALVHFTLPRVPPGCKLVGATLRLYSSSATEGRTLEALRVASDWSEFGITWANQPETAGPAATTQSGLAFREWNVLDQTRDMYALGDHGFLIRDAAENRSGEQSLHSNEKGIDGPPELVLVFDDPNATPPPDVCPTTPQSVSADRDSWVSQDSPSNNFGTDSTLKVKSQLGYNARALVRFALPPLPAGCIGVDSAILRLNAQSATEGRTLEALQVASAWSETNVTWSNQPATTGPAVATPSGAGALEWAVTGQVQDMFVSANHGFLIRDAEENGVGEEQTLNSRLKLSDGPPELILIFDDGTPKTRIDAGPDGPTNDSTPSFDFSSSEAGSSFQCRVDTAEFAPCNSPHTTAPLADGAHSFEVQATDADGNKDATPARRDFTVDTGAPETTIDAGPTGPTNDPTPTFDFSSEPGASIQCRVDAGAFAACTSPHTTAALADDAHTFEVKATDAAGNTDATPAGLAFIVDTGAPETTIDAGGPDGPTNDSTPSFDFSSSEPGSSFECSVDAGAFAACTSPHTADLADGAHTFEVKATDAAGNTDATPAGRAFTVDTVAPETMVDAGPTGLTNDSTPTFDFSSEPGASFLCKVDAAAFAACTSPHTTPVLADGAHSFEVKATDAAGNADSTPAGTAFTVDTVAPETVVNAGPNGLTNDPTPTYAFSSEPGASFECRVDSGSFAACSSPHTTAALADGDHTFEVRAKDAVGNTDGSAASRAITVDTAAPQTIIDSRPPATTASTSASFTFSSESGATFECALDAAAFAACTSPRQYTGLAAGAHQFRVRAIDAAGNTDASPATYNWTIDTTAPQTTIGSAPPATTASTSASFTFSSEAGATFECALDAAAFAACASPRQYTGLAAGSHQFRVRARDAAGNTDASPASYTWTISATAPTCPATTTANALADAWIDENSPASNSGGDSILKVQSKGPRDNFRTLVRFTLPALEGCVVEQATLRLYAPSVKTGRILQVLRVAAAWSENAVSWSSQPQTTGTAATTASRLGYTEWNVTSHVQAMVDEGANHGFLIRDAVEGADAEQQFHSREKGESPPQLVIRFATSGGA
jgi:predicted outer membrane repeat protein